MKIGYINQSFKYPNETQIEELIKYGCNELYIQSQKEIHDKIDYLTHLLDGDILVVTNFVVLASSVQELLGLFRLFESKNIILHSIEPPFQSDLHYTFNYMLELMAIFVQNIKYQKQQIGIQKAKLQGKKLGRKPKLTQKTIQKCIEYKKQYTSKELANRYGVSKSTLLRHIANYKNSTNLRNTF